MPSSLMDVGCGRGTWLKAASDCGISDLMGVDGVAISPEEFLLEGGRFECHDLTRSWTVGRRFEAVLCLEVGEHLAAAHADTLVQSLTRHADTVIFSAACPGQPGQHHVNCQWPAYWQEIFNKHGFSCYDTIRPSIWQDTRIEPWYRQNVFLALNQPDVAGKEERLRPLVHPDMLPYLHAAMLDQELKNRVITAGSHDIPVSWLASALVRRIGSKLSRLVRGVRV
ncbi:class I SAM-dependent methyltransferase [Roseimicrobium sp. ORNL1]|nr:class I SAM-dependent methyltransferase [Roseimicrobium sp. ORNL1]